MISKWLVLRVSAAILILAFVTILAVALAPFMVNGPGLRKQLLSQIGELTGGEVTINGRVGLASFLSLSMEAEDVEISGVKKLSAVDSLSAGRVEARLDWLAFFSGGKPFEQLVIEAPRFELAAGRGAKASAQSALLDMLAALENSPFEELVIRKASFSRREIVVPTPGASAPSEVKLPVDILTAKLSRSKGGRKLSAKGRIRWNDQVLAFKGQRGRAAALDGVVRLPVELSVSGAPMRLAFSGDLVMKEPLEAVGNLSFTAPAASQLPQWLGLSWSLPEGVNTVSAEGALSLANGHYILDAGAFSINGYHADGNLMVNLAGACPAIQGSLAFRMLDLDFLLRTVSGKIGNGAGASLVSCLDADLRISADAVSAGVVRTGSGAAGVWVKSGKITANIAELEIFDGIARGNIEVDLSTAEPVFAMRMTAEDVDISRLTETVQLGRWLEGRAGVNAELRAKGRRLSDIQKSLNGQTKITLTDGGALSEAVKAMIASADKAIPGELGPAEVIRPSFKSLRAELAAKDGVVRAKIFDLSEDSTRMSLEGSIDIVRKTLACNLNVRTTEVAAALQRTNQAVQTLTMEGPWNSPKFVWNGRPLAFGESNITGSAPF